MSIIPSLSVWSSIKIRPPGYYNRNSNEAKSSVSYVNSWSRMKQKYNVRTVSEVVNLRVPSPLWKGAECPDVLPVTPEIVRKRSSIRGKARDVGHVTAPHAPELCAGRKKDCGKDGANPCYKPFRRPNSKEAYDDELTQNIYFDDKFPDPDSDDGMEMNCIPTVKPWTPEELRALSKRYNLMEDKANLERKKNKRKVKTTRSEQKTPRKQCRTPCSDARKSRKSSRPNSSSNDLEPQNNKVDRQGVFTPPTEHDLAADVM